MSNTVKKVQTSVLPYYGLAAVWAVYALLFDLYKISHFLSVTVLSVLVFFVLKSICRGEIADKERGFCMSNTVMKVQTSVLPYYGLAAVWVVYALLFDLYKISHFLSVTILSVLTFFVLKSICRDKIIEEELTSSGDLGKTENAELDAVIENGKKSLQEMRNIKNRMGNASISSDISRMEAAAQKIFDHIRENPKKLPQIRHFLHYYLPTTLKLLNAYDSLDAIGISGRNIDNTKEKIATVMSLISSAFEAQLDHLWC